ncbi:ABC transporter substrate-binding protein [Nitratireductor basaltis]|nr:ABC transporter substrate-binding protein [Nitratireductor basaltis]
MSLNLCTDQLALALAGPDELVSVSFLAREPSMSPEHEKARAINVNHGRAEEVFLADPDLVVTGTFSLHNTTQLLKKLGFRVEEFGFNQQLDAIPEDIRRMGELLHRQDKAQTLAAKVEKELAAAKSQACGPAPSMLIYDQNGVSPGAGTLAHSVIEAAGFRNLAAELGVNGVAPFPLEAVVAARPDVIITSSATGNAPTLGAMVPRHPALQALSETLVGDFIPDGTLSCASHATVDAVRALSDLRRKLAPCSAQESGQ